MKDVPYEKDVLTEMLMALEDVPNPLEKTPSGNSISAETWEQFIRFARQYFTALSVLDIEQIMTDCLEEK